jgi:TPR repeat protein
MVETVSPVKQVLRKGDFAQLDALLARQEESAAGDNRAERNFKITLDDLAYATDADMKLLEQWAGGDSHYARLALARAYRIRGGHERTENYANSVDPLRLERFREYSRRSYAYAEEAAKLHPGCGVAYGQMIESLVGIAKREEMDSLFARSQDIAPQWNSPLASYFYALHPNWYGQPDERKQFIEHFAESNPGHRAIGRLRAMEYGRMASLALNERKYGEGIILADLALEHDSLYSYAWKDKGRAFKGGDRAEDALRSYDKAIELNPFNAEAYRERGQLRLTMGRADGQDDLARAGLLGDTWSLKQTIWNWLTGRTAGVAKDWSRVPDYCERTRQYGIPEGVFCVATAHYFGYGVPRDVKKGFAMMKEAADIGVPDAMSDVGKTYWTGEAPAGVKRDKELALRYWMRAAAIGNNRALVELNQVKRDPEIIALLQKIHSENSASEESGMDERPDITAEIVKQ